MAPTAWTAAITGTTRQPNSSRKAKVTPAGRYQMLTPSTMAKTRKTSRPASQSTA